MSDADWLSQSTGRDGASRKLFLPEVTSGDAARTRSTSTPATFFCSPQWGLSLRHIRGIISHLREQGYESPPREVCFALSGSHVLFQHDDGSREDSRHPIQGVIRQVIDLQAIRSQARGRQQRSETHVGVVEKRRKVQAFKPVFRGTRVPVETVKDYLEAGKSTSEILDSFPSLTEEDIKAAETSSSTVA